ncbi:PIN domain-containing protein [Sphingomonas panni]
MTTWLLDTNIISDLMRHPEGIVAKRIAEIGDANVVTSIVVAAELRFGVERRGSTRLRARLDAILDILPVLPLGDDADKQYARLRTDLERRGTPIGANDMLIAAHALAEAMVLATDNVDEFERVDGLIFENWLRP